MKKLFNVSDFYENEDILKKIKNYRDKYNFQGVELIKFTEKNNEPIRNHVIGYHMRFFPMWVDLYLNKNEIIERELLSSDPQEYFYLCGGHKREEMINFYREELERAKNLEAEYVVIHMCNVRPSETFTYDFHYDDQEILKYLVEIINEIFEEENYKFQLLLENLWWPGLKLHSKKEIEYILKNIKYKNIGFMLDTGHMLNSNLELKNSREAVEYLDITIDNLGEYKKYIRGVHLNYSLSGEYVKSIIEKRQEEENVYMHISKIDSHEVFEDRRIIEILKKLDLKYLVYEFIGYTEEDLEEKIAKQDSTLFFQ
ncbi:TIM barrel protein [Cetobacterium sp. SF1]|uniref:TIM barrel protein n=1 Tax=Cetobacterium sp. SF1 TaxID=3417654 RepID=UPI003CEEF10C